jgi:putative ABC transport system permease protein
MNWRRKRHAELDEEIAAHLRMASADRIDRGETPAQAASAARRELGNPALVKETTREAWGWAWLARLGQDVRYGVRMLRRAPGFTAVVALTLALGIGANTAIFSLIQAAMNALPIPEPDRVYMVWTQNTRRGLDQLPVSAGDYRDMKASGVFSSIGALNDAAGNNLRIDGRTARVTAIEVTPDLFQALETRPQLGRLFGEEDMRPGSEPAILLTDEFWHSRFSGDPSVLGRSIVLDGVPASIAGVLPANFPKLGQPDIYTPLIFDAASLADRGKRRYGAMGRLKPGVTPGAAQSALNELAARLEREDPVKTGGSTFRLQSAEDAYVSDARSMLLILLGAVGFVLLIACANIANLLLARGTVRAREMSVRIALGASRWRLARQLLTESVLLALVGGALAIIPAAWGIHLIATSHFDVLPAADLIRLNGGVLAFSFGTAAVTGIFFGITPALQAWKTNVNGALRTAGRGLAGGAHRRLRSVFVVAEVALTLILLVGAGLMLRSFIALRWANPGYDSRGVLTMRIALAEQTYGTPEKQDSFYRQLIERAAALPGVKSVGAIDELPTSDNLHGSGIHFLDRPEPRPGDAPLVLYDSVTPEYFSAMGIPLIRGRYFRESDRTGATNVALIDNYTARRYWPGEDAIGKRFKLGPKEPERTIVGIVAKVQPGTPVALFLRNKLLGQAYLPAAQAPKPEMSLAIRTSDVASATSGIRAIVQKMDVDQPLFDVMTMDEVRARGARSARLATWLMAAFAGLALLLATVGIYGVASYDVGQRRREFGIRTSLGAQRADILRLAGRRGVALALTGILIGAAGAVAITRLMSDLLYGVTSTDPATYGGVAALLAVAALAASYFPARKATRVEPNIALREE